MAEDLCPGCAGDYGDGTCANCGTTLTGNSVIIDGEYCSMECMMQGTMGSGSNKPAQNTPIADPTGGANDPLGGGEHHIGGLSDMDRYPNIID